MAEVLKFKLLKIVAVACGVLWPVISSARGDDALASLCSEFAETDEMALSADLRGASFGLVKASMSSQERQQLKKAGINAMYILDVTKCDSASRGRFLSAASDILSKAPFILKKLPDQEDDTVTLYYCADNEDIEEIVVIIRKSGMTALCRLYRKP